MAGYPKSWRWMEGEPPPKKNLLLSIESWLVYRDRLIIIRIFNWVSYNPLCTLNHQGFFGGSGDFPFQLGDFEVPC